MNKKIFFSILGILLFIGGLVLLLFLVKQRQDLRNHAAPSTSLGFSTSNSSPAVGDTFTTNVTIDTGVNQVVGTELYITFDHTKLQAQTVSAGNFFSGPNAIGPTIDNNAGTIYYTLNLPPGVVPVSGTGTLATITFQATGAGAAQLDFTDSSIVIAVGEGGQNVLQNRNGTTINVVTAGGGATTTPSPTVQPTSGPTATPTPTQAPTVAPTATPTPTTSGQGGNATATPTPTLAPTAAPTVTPTYTPVPTASPVPTTNSETSGTGGTSATATPAPTTSSNGSVQVTLNTIQNGQIVYDTTPTFTGVAAAGSTVSITIHSDQNITGTVTTNSSSTWTYTPTTALDLGSHIAQITATDPQGRQTTTSVSFTVAAQGSGAPALPTSGFELPSIIGIGVGALLLLVGALAFIL